MEDLQKERSLAINWKISSTTTKFSNFFDNLHNLAETNEICSKDV